MNNTKQAIAEVRPGAAPYERRLERFYWLLSQRELTTEMLAEIVGTGRAHLCLVLNNTPGRGGQTRRKLTRLCWPEGHKDAGEPVLSDEMLKELGWDREGRILKGEG